MTPLHSQDLARALASAAKRFASSASSFWAASSWAQYIAR